MDFSAKMGQSGRNMNNSQPTEPAGGQPEGAPPSERWIGAESASAAAPEPPGDPEPPAHGEPAADAAVSRPARSRLAGALGLDAVRIRATLRIAGTREPSDQDTKATEPEPAPAKRGRSHLRLVPPSEPEPEPAPHVTHTPVPANPPASPPAPASMAAPIPDVAPPALPEPQPRPIRIFSELSTLAGIVLIGTAAALGVDAVIGGLNGLPPAYLLVFLASPIWDLLPGRLPARLAVIALDTAATIGVWFLVAALPMQRWLDVQRGYWRAEIAFGLACLLVGALHLLIALALRRRPPQRPQPPAPERAVP